MSNNGWIKLHRQIIDCWVWDSSEPFTKAQAWIYLLLMANHSDKKILLDGNLITLHAGEFLTSIKKLSDTFEWGVGRVSRFLKLLEDDEMIKTNRGKNGTVLTIVNYGKFQIERNDSGTIAERERNANGTQTERERNDSGTIAETNKNDKNVKNEKKKKKSTASAKFSEDELVQAAFDDFLEMRIKIKHPMTERAIKGLKLELEKLSLNPVEQAKILDQSTFKSWQGVFPLKDDFVPLRDYEYPLNTKDASPIPAEIDPNAGLDKYVAPEDDDSNLDEWMADKAAHPFEEGWRINDDGYWIKV